MGIQVLFFLTVVAFPVLGYFILRWIAGNEPLQPTELPEERAQREAEQKKTSGEEFGDRE